MPAVMTMHYRVLQVVYTLSVEFEDYLHLYYWGESERSHIDGLHIMAPFADYACLFGDGLVYVHTST